MIHNYNEMNKNNSKTNKIIPEKNKKSSKITYEIAGNENEIDKQIVTEQTYKNKYIAKSIPFPEDFSVKMILGSPAKVRATAARIIKAGTRGEIPQTLVNSLIWQLRSLVYFDQVCADLSYMARIEALEKALKKAEK